MFKKLTKVFLYAVAVTLAVVSTVTVYAAFIAPSDTPAASVQDWIGNVLGANNADNAYDSSAVVGNHDGSLLERAEDIRKTVADNTYDSSFATANANGSVLQILKDIKASVAADGKPGGWTCRQVNGSWDYSSQASCTAPEKIITGGCDTNGGVSTSYTLANLYWNGLNGNAWYCAMNNAINGGSQIVLATAWCCK